MSRLLVCGHINMETTVKVEAFPIDYVPVHYAFWGVQTAVSGVGYNLAKALTTLGNDVDLLSVIGQGEMGMLVRAVLARDGINGRFVLPLIGETGQSAILYDDGGRRRIYTDLKNIQEQLYPMEMFETAVAACQHLMLCNINYSRPLLARAQALGKTIATDVHTISDLDDAYNQDYMAAAHILFMSHEHLPCSPEAWIKRVQNRYGTAIIVIGLGREGALLAVRNDNFVERVSAVFTRPVVNTIGAGDALFAAFNHVYAATGDAYEALQQAVVFASYKIGVSGGAKGFLTDEALKRWVSGAA